jgi:hypothetical protein
MSETGYRYPVDMVIDDLDPIKMDDEFGGRVFKPGDSVYSPGLRKVLEIGGGWVFEGDGGSSIVGKAPDTHRLVESAKAADVPIRLTVDTSEPGNIPPEYYGELVLGERVHPVGVGSTLGYYRHDIGLDHFPAVVVAGRGLFELLVPAKRIGDGTLVDVAHAYDRSTMTIRSALDDHLNPRHTHERILFGGYADEVGDCLGFYYGITKVRIEAIERLLKAGLERLELV